MKRWFWFVTCSPGVLFFSWLLFCGLNISEIPLELSILGNSFGICSFLKVWCFLKAETGSFLRSLVLGWWEYCRWSWKGWIFWLFYLFPPVNSLFGIANELVSLPSTVYEVLSLLFLIALTPEISLSLSSNGITLWDFYFFLGEILMGYSRGISGLLWGIRGLPASSFISI